MANQLRESIVLQIGEALAYIDATLRNEEGRLQASKGSFDTFVALALAAITRATGTDSVYAREANHVVAQRDAERRTDWTHIVEVLAGILRAVREAIDAGYLSQAADVIHGSVFADFLEMSLHLLEQGYKDASAVVAGSSLEAHLRYLCEKNGVDPTTGEGRPKRADRLNADLVKAKAYGPLEQKNVTAWLGLRNSAAHGEYDRYTAEMVTNMIDGVRYFITRSLNA